MRTQMAIILLFIFSLNVSAEETSNGWQLNVPNEQSNSDGTSNTIEKL